MSVVVVVVKRGSFKVTVCQTGVGQFEIMAVILVDV